MTARSKSVACIKDLEPLLHRIYGDGGGGGDDYDDDDAYDEDDDGDDAMVNSNGK